MGMVGIRRTGEKDNNYKMEDQERAAEAAFFFSSILLHKTEYDKLSFRNDRIKKERE